MPSYKLCIVGTGAAGLLTLFCLSFTKIPPEEVVCIDPYHDGGDLQRKWCCVQSNTIWDQMIHILRAKQIPVDSLPSPWLQLDASKPAELRHYIQLLRYITKSYLSKCETIYSTVSSFVEENGQVRVNYGNGESLLTKICIITTGSNPKQYSYPIPTIPLEIALNRTRLASYLQPNQTVSLFGTAHSGTLILSNLHSLQVNTHAFYKGEKPFLFARDGEYDGIKQESEIIADQIVAGHYPQVSLHSITNTAELIRWTRRSDWVIYASGFQRTDLTASFSYDGQTGQIQHLPNTWGFGIAFPNRAPDGIHWDVSIPSFFEHIEKQIPTIVESFYA
jgi:hypothetical protein